MEMLLPKPCDAITFGGENSSYRGFIDFYRFFLKIFPNFVNVRFFLNLHVCGEMFSKKCWAFQPSRSKASRKLQKPPGGTSTGRARRRGCSRAQSGGELPSPDGSQSSAHFCKESCPAAARKNGLEADPSLGSAGSAGGKIFAVKL